MVAFHGVTMTYDFRELLGMSAPIDRVGLVVERGADGVRANVSHVVWHSPGGLDFGRSGPGAADLALSVMCALIPPPTTENERRAWNLKGIARRVADADDALWSLKTPQGMRISKLAWTLHDLFMRTFVMTMKEDVRHLPVEIMRSWIDMQVQGMRDRADMGR